ncbi:MAG: winged helix-turn-helix domain-containing protein [Prevotellaceae bacterium]|jgi:hypothetical protein|nr:winged helix-turn-helix domain-containing protein [Prevotellaceae bacterium]
MCNADIEANAGVIWRLLSDKGVLSVREIVALTSYRELFVSLALGWLAREDRIQLFEKDRALYVKLEHSSFEWYF